MFFLILLMLIMLKFGSAKGLLTILRCLYFWKIIYLYVVNLSMQRQLRLLVCLSLILIVTLSLLWHKNKKWRIVFMSRQYCPKDLFDRCFNRYFRGRDCELSCLYPDFISGLKADVKISNTSVGQIRHYLKDFLIGTRFKYIVLKSTQLRGCALLFKIHNNRLVCLNPNMSTTRGLGVRPFMAYYSNLVRHFNILPF